ncbi:threonylcarbamoyl-AMP synthase [Candidatus Kaiserbacteria bacterium]|nr:threonylcarbamoyl-AMP synthase [Candidatus Kaiserbacteria bacterium]
METIQLQNNLGTCVLKASGMLQRGGVIIYPTDTLYGLGADALSDEAVAKVYEIKGRNEGKPMHAVFADMEMVREYAEVNDTAEKLAERFLPGALTLILIKKPQFNAGFVKGIDTIGVRIPDNEFCLELARTFGKPYTATSANIAGQVPQLSVEKVLEQLGPNAKGVDQVIDGGVLSMRQPTTVVRVANGEIFILREGAILKEEILAT